MKKQQNWLLLGDLHVGSRTGLSNDPGNPIQEELYSRWNDCRRYIKTLNVGSLDAVVCNGDAIDGPDRKSHDIDNPDMLSQAEEAAELLASYDAKEYYVIAGTGYHTGVDGQDIERHVAKCLQALGKTAHYYDNLSVSINGWFNLWCRHFINASQVPHGRSTAQARKKYWKVLNEAIDAKGGGRVAEWPDLTVFSHVHYYNYQEDAFGAVMSLPAWQASGGKYGSRICGGHIDIGSVLLTVGKDQREGFSCQKRLYPARMVSQKVIR